MKTLKEMRWSFDKKGIIKPKTTDFELKIKPILDEDGEIVYAHELRQDIIKDIKGMREYFREEFKPGKETPKNPMLSVYNCEEYLMEKFNISEEDLHGEK